MLELVIGCSGSGKSHYIIKELEALAAAHDRPVFLLVPEQASFENERTLLNRLGPVKAARVQVRSFRRLADTVAREVGGLTGRPLDDGTRALLMSRALEQVAAVDADLGKPMAGLSARRGAQAAYVEQLVALWEEMRQNGVSTQELEQVAAELAAQPGESAGLLQEKTADLYRVFTAYEGLAAAVGMDEQDRLNRLAASLPDCRLLEDAAVFIDGFKGFTAPELAVLEGLMIRARRMTVALSTDTPGRAWPGTPSAACRREFPLFSPVTETVEQLRRLAQDHGMHWELKSMAGTRRTTDGALQALETELYAPAPTVYEMAAEQVTVTPCGDIYEECAYVARRVRRLLREEGYRCRDITLVARNLTDYQGILDDALDQQGVPYYIDARRDLLCEPLVVYTRAALRLAVGGWCTEEVLRLLKTDLGPLEPLETAALENYVYMWRIDGRTWEQEWTENPVGLGAPVTSATARQLAQLNKWRRQVMTPLVALRHELRGRVTGYGFATALYTFLEDDGRLASRVAAQCARLEALAEPVLASHASRLWDEVMAVLDRFALALGDQVMATDRLEELFTMLCELIDMGSIPQSLDAVTVGSADRIRYASPRAVFILGANEGVFPAYPSAEGIFSQAERQRLKEQGLLLSGDTLRRCVEERYYAYMAVAAPSHRLIVTYLTEGEQVASPLVTAIDTILPYHGRGEARRLDGTDLECAGEMFARMAESYDNPTATGASLRQVIADLPAFSARLEAVERSAAQTPFRLEKPDTARALFGTEMCLSASQTERFYSCHFSYFCRYGLHLKPRSVAQVDAAVFGTLVHHVMETLLPMYVQPGGLVSRLRAEDTAMTADQRERTENRRQAELMASVQPDVRRVTEAYIEQEMGGIANKSGRFLYQVSQAQRAAGNMLWHTLMELRQSAFEPVDFELSIHPEGEGEEGLLSLRLPHAAGTVQVRGQIDRVDIYVRGDGTTYARVVDYKTGTKKFDLSELAAGLSMQMLLYLFILCDNSRRYMEENGQLHPAGVLYQPLSDLVVKRKESGRQRLKSMAMSGLVLDDPAVVQAMEADAAQVFIPAGLDKGGQVKGSAVTPAQFNLLRRVVEQLLTAMADDLLAGRIEAVPLQRGVSLPCDYCDYRAVCGREPESPARVLEKQSMKAVLERLETADGEGVTAYGGETVE